MTKIEFLFAFLKIFSIFYFIFKIFHVFIYKKFILQ